MADRKVSELVEATSAAIADVFLMVQGGVSKRIAKANLFKNTIETLTTVTIVDPTIDTTVIDNTAGNTLSLTLAAGTEGMMKTIILKANTGIITLTASNSVGFASIGFVAAGDTVTLHYAGSVWSIVGKNGVIIA